MSTTTARCGAAVAGRTRPPKVNVAAARSMSHGSSRRKPLSEGRISRNAPTNPPSRLTPPRLTSHRLPVTISGRWAIALEIDPGHRATADVALAATGVTPANISAGNVMNEPPPATALSAPPRAAARNRKMLSTTTHHEDTKHTKHSWLGEEE